MKTKDQIEHMTDYVVMSKHEIIVGCGKYDYNHGILLLMVASIKGSHITACAYDYECPFPDKATKIAQLLLRQSESSGSENRVRSRERLGTRTNRLQNLAGRQTLVTAKVNQERIQITVEAIDRADSNEREDSHLSIGAFVQLKLLAGNRDGGDGTASRGDGTSATKSRQPDHDFVLGGAGGRCTGEEIVGDVGDDVRPGVAPGPGRGQ